MNITIKLKTLEAYPPEKESFIIAFVKGEEGLYLSIVYLNESGFFIDDYFNEIPASKILFYFDENEACEQANNLLNLKLLTEAV